MRDCGCCFEAPITPVMLAYQLYMLTGQTALTDLQNDRYDGVKLETFAQVRGAQASFESRCLRAYLSPRRAMCATAVPNKEPSQ